MHQSTEFICPCLEVHSKYSQVDAQDWKTHVSEKFYFLN